MNIRLGWGWGELAVLNVRKVNEKPAPALQEVEGTIVEKEGFVVVVMNTEEELGDGLIEV